MQMFRIYIVCSIFFFNTISVNTEHISDSTINICSVFNEIVLKLKNIVDTKHNSDNTFNLCLECNIIFIFTKKSVPITYGEEDIHKKFQLLSLFINNQINRWALQYQDIKNVHKTTYQNIDC